MNFEKGRRDLVREDEKDIGLPGVATIGLGGCAGWCVQW